MKSLLHIFRHNRLAFSLNLLGMILAFTGCYVLLTQIVYVDYYNRGIKGCENIRRLYSQGVFSDDLWTYTFSRPFLDELKKCPQIESVGYSRLHQMQAELVKEGDVIVAPLFSANEDLLLTVNAEKVDGDLRCRYEGDAPGAVIPASLSEKYFGTLMSVGKQLKIKYFRSSLTVTGVYKDFPDNSSIDNAVYFNMGDENIHSVENWNYSAYIRTRADVDEQSLLKNIHTVFEEMEKARLSEPSEDDLQDLKESVSRIKISAMPITETFLNGHDSTVDKGNKFTLFIEKCAVWLLLIVVLSNYANFIMSLAPLRVRGINTRKVMGETNLRLRMQLVGEGIIISLVAFVLAMVAVYCIGLWEHIGEYVLGSIRLTDHVGLVLLMAVISILIGIAASVFSARYITSFQPASVLKGHYGLSLHFKPVRQMLVGLQLMLSFVLIVFIVVMYSQNFYIRNSDYGYQKDALLFGSLNDIPYERHEALRNELEKIHGVESVAYSDFQFGLYDNTMQWVRGNSSDSMMMFHVIPVDWKILPTLGIDIIEGRDFQPSDGDVFIVNEAMKKQYPHIEVDKPLRDGDLPVVGICKNFRAFSTRRDNYSTAIAFIIFGKQYEDWGAPDNSIYIRIAANTDKVAVRKSVNQVLSAFYVEGPVPEMKFLDERMEEAYRDELRFQTQMETSCMLIFAITLIGVFCLTMFETEYRRKEIAIRKVMGSTVGQVLSLFVRRYSRPLVISFVLAAPVSYYISEQWLKNFAEHTPIHWWIFPLSFLLISAIVLATVVVQSWRVATMNPIESIKTE